MISMWVLWRRLRLNQEGSEAALSEVVANGLLTRYSDIIYDWFLLFNSIPYTMYIILHYIHIEFNELLNHIYELWRKIWSYDYSWHLCTSLNQLWNYSKPEKKIQAGTGYQSMTSAIPVLCSNNRAIEPTENWSHGEFAIYPYDRTSAYHSRERYDDMIYHCT